MPQRKRSCPRKRADTRFLWMAWRLESSRGRRKRRRRVMRRVTRDADRAE